MRLHRLEITGVGPFRDHQVIDFEPMMAAGLFLIDGPTGSGKTTIIDAVTFALFGTTSGFASDSDRFRSDYCTTEDPTEVVLEFSVRGRRHRISRSPEYLRATRRRTESGVTKQAARQNLIEYAPDGSESLTLISAADIGVHVQELLGMGSQQFRQLVVLPQGEFAHLLRMSPRERLDALQHLLGSDFFQQVQDTLVERAERARSDLQAAESRVEQAIRAVITRAAETELSFDDAITPAEKTESVVHAALEQIVDEAQQQLQQAEHHDEVAQIALTTATRERDDTERAARAMRTYADAEAEVRGALEDLGMQEVDESALEVASREAMELIGTLRPLVDWEAAAPDRALDREALVQEVESCRVRVDALKGERERLPGERADAEHQRDEAEAIIRQRPLLEQRAKELEEGIRQRERIEQLSASLESLQRVVEEAEAGHGAARASLLAAETEVETLFRAHIAAQAAALAEGLVPGEPCPVCGSAEHPHPALPREGETSDRDLHAAQGRMRKARKAVEAAAEQHRQAEGEVRDQAATLKALTEHGHRDLSAVPEVELSDVRQQLATLEGLVGELPKLATKASALKTREEQLGDQLHAADLALVQARERLQGFDERVQETLEVLHRVTNGTDSATDLLSRLSTRVDQLEQVREGMRKMRSVVAELGDPNQNLDEALLRATVAGEAFAETQNAAKLARDRVVTLRNAHKALMDLAEEVRTSIESHASVAASIHDLVQIADIAAARTLTNTQKLTLATYAVQLRFANVLDSASMHLERMSGGQYTFVLDTEVQGRGLAGLGIHIRDSWTGQDRDPKTLSGGETFYASLALALGLADVIQAETGGAELETLFVDEGFGSLDPDTLQLVLDQLDNLRSGGRVVGVISHVAEMKERIPDRIQVISQLDHTSAVRQVPEIAPQFA